MGQIIDLESEYYYYEDDLDSLDAFSRGKRRKKKKAAAAKAKEEAAKAAAEAAAAAGETGRGVGEVKYGAPATTAKPTTEETNPSCPTNKVNIISVLWNESLMSHHF